MALGLSWDRAGWLLGWMDAEFQAPEKAHLGHGQTGLATPTKEGLAQAGPLALRVRDFWCILRGNADP